MSCPSLPLPSVPYARVVVCVSHASRPPLLWLNLTRSFPLGRRFGSQQHLPVYQYWLVARAVLALSQRLDKSENQVVAYI
ncbi:hypothetical protein RRG08_036453 [Elysia crispata]|uniref:Uncharacterized protein n=1 Tax=Elysia crispata TaxID=231223 RepID=A0AAE0ZKC1_9GAST|nr:hypothetical protein RRG08_036453 [Elysia crispata]